MSSACSRSSRAPTAWNVPAHIASVMRRCRPARDRCRMRSTRRVISAAARREKVSSMMRRGSAPFSIRMRDAMRERVGLARAGAGDDEQRTGLANRRAAVLDGAALLRIEFFEAPRRHRPESPVCTKRRLNHNSGFVRKERAAHLANSPWKLIRRQRDAGHGIFGIACSNGRQGSPKLILRRIRMLLANGDHMAEIEFELVTPLRIEPRRIRRALDINPRSDATAPEISLSESPKVTRVA